jgi:hypothetical protein
MTEFWVAIATVRDKKRNEGSDALHTGTINDRTTVSRAAHQSRPSEDGKVRRECVVWAANCLRERTSSEAIRLGAYKQSEDFQSGWLAEGR